MGRSKVAISLDESTLNRLDKLVQKQVFPNRSQAIEEAVAEKLARLEKSRLAQECANLDPKRRKGVGMSLFFDMQRTSGKRRCACLISGAEARCRTPLKDHACKVE